MRPRRLFSIWLLLLWCSLEPLTAAASPGKSEELALASADPSTSVQRSCEPPARQLCSSRDDLQSGACCPIQVLLSDNAAVAVTTFAGNCREENCDPLRRWWVRVAHSGGGNSPA